MGSTYRARVQQSIVSRRRTQFSTTENKAEEYRAVGGSTSNDKTSKEESYRQVMARYNEGRMDKTK